MKKLIPLTLLLWGCVTMGIRANGDYVYLPELKEDIRNHGFETPQDVGLGFAFGVGVFHPDWFLIRGKFSQINLRDSKSFLYTYEGWVEGGIPIIKNRYFAFYPLIGFGAENQIVKLDKKFEGYTYGILLGFENHLILTKEKPGYLAFILGANVKRIAGIFLDAPFDFLISPPHTRFQIFVGIEMGYIYEK